jgi:hypothetical protein
MLGSAATAGVEEMSPVNPLHAKFVSWIFLKGSIDLSPIGDFLQKSVAVQTQFNATLL